MHAYSTTKYAYVPEHRLYGIDPTAAWVIASLDVYILYTGAGRGIGRLQYFMLSLLWILYSNASR